MKITEVRYFDINDNRKTYKLPVNKEVAGIWVNRNSIDIVFCNYATLSIEIKEGSPINIH